MSEQRRTNAEIREKRYEDGFRVLQGQREYVTYPDNTSVRIWYSEDPWRFEEHVHSAVEIVLTLEGSVEYVVDGVPYTVRKDEVLVIPHEAIHSLAMGENSSRLLFLFEPDVLMSLRDLKRLPGLFDRVFYLHDGSETHTRIREMLLKIRSIEKEQNLAWNAMIYSYLIRIYSALCQHYMSGVINRGRETTVRAVDQEVITASMVYINEHYYEELSLDDVAAFAGFSRYYFSRSFKKQTGYFFKDYLCQKRLQVAMELLTRTELSMREVASRSGFGSVATFNRAFREKNGCTPSKYRAIYGGR